MNTLVKTKPKLRRAYVPTTALAKAVEFDADMMHVFLTDGRIVQRERYEIGGGGVSLHWPETDEDLSVANLMAGVDWQSA
jgi:hypothetical protein